MKPHLLKWRGIWHCWDRSSPFVTCGLGYTPSQAFDDWLWLTWNQLSEAPHA